MQDRPVLILNEEEYQLPELSEFWEMVRNIFVFPKMYSVQHDQ